MNKETSHHVESNEGEEKNEKEANKYWPSYETVIKETKYWHGTGRYQYDENGSVIDVLSNILRNGFLNTKADEYNIHAQGKRSIPLAYKRFYALKYADMHRDNINEQQRNYSSTEFVDLYISPVGAQIYQESLRQRGEKITEIAIRKMMASGWAKKANRSANRPGEAFLFGSDIAHNYPILFGIKEPELSKVPLPSYLSSNEVRYDTPIPISKISHIEVPAIKVYETEKILSSFGIDKPLFAIELGESMDNSHET